MQFVYGDKKRADKWSLLSGAAQFTDNRIALTSPPDEAGMLYLNGSDEYRDIRLTAKAAGNVVGKQTVYVRYDRQKESFLRITPG
ncbi:hypothetical protein [Paenibacillus sp. MBLB4367]|uniref:hypothetical protein n=1 Tax=Paenibacillus sp. MBLB4367 TaxID=3384767 RepID=UPI0039083E04